MAKGGIIQIAGVHDAEEARLLVDCGVDWIGLPFHLDRHREDLGEAEARAVVETLPETILPVLITYLDDLEAVLALGDFMGTRAVQLHGPAAPALGEGLKRRRPDWLLIRSLVIRGEDITGLEAEARDWAPFADYFLTDTFDPATGASGATGKTHDWELSRRLAEGVARPLILAGGLRPDNVGEAIRRVRPAGVDAHTGVENSQRRKDPELLQRFILEARAAFAKSTSERSGNCNR
ncbi:MAG: phosphoribosylanthranilate isomerase [Deltaproteobacteria bacterium]|nr:phosphoribosylanthranilate isomerase [Deltaproteobacteria bacterium]